MQLRPNLPMLSTHYPGFIWSRLALGLCNELVPFLAQRRQRWSRLCNLADLSNKKQSSAEDESITGLRQSRVHKGLSILQAKANSTLAVQGLLAADSFKAQ